jgi:hypothetical protein
MGSGSSIHEIHRHIDWVIERKKNNQAGILSIWQSLISIIIMSLSLIYALKNGIGVDCVADWASVSSMNCTENVAKLRRAGIPVCGVVRNTPNNQSEGIASMHTKFIIFDGVVHSAPITFISISGVVIGKTHSFAIRRISLSFIQMYIML